VDCLAKFGVVLAVQVASLALVAAPAFASPPSVPAAAPVDPVAALDAISYATDRPETGIALANDQINAGDLVDGLATLERVLLNHPDSISARVFRASLMCRLDDPQGAMLEFQELRARGVTDAALQEASKPCNQGRPG
jgi:hypothetical protein